MNKVIFFKSLDKIQTAKQSFEIMENMSFNSIEPYVRLFGLPMEPHSINYMQKLRCALLNAISYYYGVKHLNNNKFPELGAIELEKCKVLTENLLNMDIDQYGAMYNFLFEADPSKPCKIN